MAGQNQAVLNDLIAKGSMTGPFQTTRTSHQQFSIGRTWFPDVEGTPDASDSTTAVHVTLPQLPSGPGSINAPLPVVILFNCFALSLQKCDWYFEYADHLASWGFAVLQYQEQPWKLPGTHYIVNCLLDWVHNRTALDGNPLPPDNVTFDKSRLAFIGHSRGGADAAYMLAQQPPDIKATAVLIDGVDMPVFFLAPYAKDAMTKVPPPGRHQHPIALIKAAVSSFFFSPSAKVNALLEGANVMSPNRVIAATAENFAHFSCVDPEFERDWRSRLSWLNLDTNRPYHTTGDVRGCFEICAGMMVAFLRHRFEANPDPRWAQLFPRVPEGATWDDYKL